MKTLWRKFKRFTLNSVFLGILFFIMNVLSRLPYAQVWNSDSIGVKVLFGVIALDLWLFMNFLLERYMEGERGN